MRCGSTTLKSADSRRVSPTLARCCSRAPARAPAPTRGYSCALPFEVARSLALAPSLDNVSLPRRGSMYLTKRKALSPYSPLFTGVRGIGILGSSLSSGALRMRPRVRQEAPKDGIRDAPLEAAQRLLAGLALLNLLAV